MNDYFLSGLVNSYDISEHICIDICEQQYLLSVKNKLPCGVRT